METTASHVESGADGETESVPTNELSNLQENFNQQQAKISALKELVRKSEADQGKNTASAQEKVRNIAQRLNHLKSKATRSRQTEKSFSEIREEASGEPSADENEPIQMQRATSMHSLPNTPLPLRARSETPGSEKIQLLRQQMEQNRLKMAERETSKRGIEQLVTQLKAKFDSSQLSLDRAHQFGSSVGDLSSLHGASATQLRHQSTGDLSGGFNLDRERIKYLEKRVKHLENEAKQKETDFLSRDPESEHLKMIQSLEEKVMDLEENLKEKDNIIAARTQAASLITESLSLKGRDTVDLLEETKQEMYKMQSNFVAAEDEAKQQIAKLEKELQAKDKRIANLEEVNDILETARFDLTLKNSELDSKTGNVEDYVIKLNELNRINETLQHRIEELENEQPTDASAAAAVEDVVVQATVEHTLKIQELEARIAELQSENDDLKKSLQTAVNAPTTDENVQDKINALEATIEAQKAECLNLSNTLQTMQEQLQEKTVEYNVLMANFSVLEEKLKSYGPKSLFSKSSSDEAQAEINKLSKQLDDANKSGIKTKLKMKQLQKQIDAFKKASDTNRELVKQSDEIQRLTEKIRELEAELLVQSSRSIASAGDEESGDRRDSMASEKAPATELEAKIKLLETTCQNQTSAIQLLEEQKLDMTADLHSTKTELSSLKGHISSIDKQEVTSQIDSIVWEEQFEENLREVEKLKQKINELMAEKADLKTRLDRYITENMELMDKIEKLSKGSSVESIEILERLTHDERLEMERFQHQNPRPSSITEEDEHRTEDDVDKVRRDSAPAEAEIGAQEHADAGYLEKIEALQEENARNLGLIDELRAEKERIGSECEALQGTHWTTLQQLKELQEDRQNLIENVNEINDIKSKLQSEIDLLTKERADVEERRRQREASEQQAASEENSYKKCLANLNVELESFRTAKDKSTKTNVAKKVAREAKKLSDLVERLVQDNDRNVELYESLKCEMEVAALARESQERSRIEQMARGIDAGQSDEDIEQLHDEINRYKEIENELQQRCAELEQQIEREQLDKEELKRSLDDITEKSNEIESSLKDENDRLNRQLQEIESKLNDANEYTFQELQKQRKEFDNLMETNKKEVDILRELVEEQKQQLITAYTEHEDELQKKMQQIADYGAQVQRLQSALDETSEQMSKANDTYAAGLTEKVDSMKLLLDENQKILDEQTASLSHKQATIETLNQQIMDLYATMEQQTAELNEKEEEIVELQKTIDQNRSELKKMNQNALAAERRAKEAETHAKKLATEFDGAKTELETKNKEQLDKLKKFAANLKKRNAQFAELEQKYNQLEASKSQVAAEPVVVERKVESVALEQSSGQLEELKETIHRLESKAKEYEAEVLQLGNELSHRSAELENLTVRLSEKTTLVDQLSAELDQRSLELERRSIELEGKNVELSELRNKLAELPTEEDVKAKAVKIEKCKAIIKERNKEIKRLKDLVESTTASSDSGESMKLQMEQLQNEKEKAESDYLNYRTCIEAELQSNALVLESVEAENAQLKERIGRLEESICICEERRSSLERHSEVLGLQLEQKQSQIENAEDEFTNRLKALVGQDEIIERKLNDLETERDTLADTVNELKMQQTDLSRRHSVLQTQLSELESTKLSDLEEENRMYREKIDRLEGELMKQKAEYEQTLAAKHAELNELENELSDHLQKIEKERRSIQEDLEKSRDENETLQEEIGRLRDSQSDLERSRSELELQMTWVQQQNDNMTQDQLEAQELRMQVVQDQTEVEHLHAQNVEMAERHRQEVANAESEMERLRRERDDLGREMDALKTQICRDQTEIVALRCSTADHETEVSALQHRINELTAFSGQIEHDHSEIEALRANKQQLESQLAALRQQIADMDSLQMHVGQNLTQDQMEVQQLRAQIGHDQTEIEALRHQVQTLQANHETELTALRQQITELDSLRMQVGQNQTDDQVFIQNENERLQALLAEKEIEIQNYQRQNLQLQMSAGAAVAAPNDPFAALSMPSDIGGSNEARIAELEQQLAAAIHEAADRRSRIAELEVTIDDLQRSSVERDTDARQLFSVVPEPAIVTHQIEPLNAASTASTSSFEQFESSQQIEDLQRNVSDLEKYVTDLEHKLKSATEENAKLHVRCKQYDEQLTALNAELTAVRERLSAAEAERQAPQIPADVSVHAAPTENEPVQMTAAMFFGGPAPSSNPFDYVGDNAGSVPVVEEVIVPKKAYICQPETLEPQTLSPLSVEEGWGDSSWGADAALEEEHQRQTVPASEQAPIQGFSGAEVQLQMEIDHLTTERDNLNAELTSMQNKYQKMLKKLREYKTKNDELEKAKRSSNSSAVVESNELDLAIQQELSDQIKALETRLKETKAEHEKDAEEKKKLLSRIDVLTAANDRMIDMKDRQDVEIEVCKTKIRELNGKLEKLSEWSDETATAPSHVEGNNSEIALRLTEAQNQNRLLEERIARLQDSVADKDDFEEEREQLLDKITTLTAEKKLLDESIATKDTQISTLQTQLSALEDQNNDYRATIDILSVESNNIKTYLDRVKEEHKQKIDENSNLSEKLRELDSRNTELARQVEEMRIYNLNRQDVEQRIQNLTATIQYKDSEIGELKESIENVRQQLQTEIEQLKAAVTNRDDELRELREARDQYVAEKEVEETKEVAAPVATGDNRELEKLISELREEKQHMEEELQVLNDQVLKHLEIEDRIKSTVLELDMKNIEISELKNTIEQLRSQSAGASGNDERIAALELQLSEKEALHQNAIDLLNVQWQQVVDQKCAEVADSWRHHLHTREEELATIENELREQLALQSQSASTPLAVAPEVQLTDLPSAEEPSTASESNANQGDLLKSMQDALESQEMEIVSLKEQLAIRSAEYARIAAAHDPYGQRMTSSHSLSGDRTGSDDSSSQSNKGSELDLAMYMLHQRDMRCEELTEEVIHLLQERDTLQLKLSNSIRQIEEIKRRTGIEHSDVSPNSAESSSDNSPVKPHDASGDGASQTGEVGDNATKKSPSSETLNLKLSELHNVNHSRDKTLYEDREQRRRQMSLLQRERDVANMPPEALAELFGPDYAATRNNSQNPSTMLLNWLWGKGDGDN